eukprot:TRINITY_DN9213_c0_g2_i1.p3 TRINITY_DN9213_c0_g2~~TRINITY_DN9213_c0_g2_i1.p3  ORF type:complete len:143 (-),score=41.28 TRINITY_DN9213_c0_g2_i1:221-649(-)
MDSADTDTPPAKPMIRVSLADTRDTRERSPRLDSPGEVRQRALSGSESSPTSPPSSTERADKKLARERSSKREQPVASPGPVRLAVPTSATPTSGRRFKIMGRSASTPTPASATVSAFSPPAIASAPSSSNSPDSNVSAKAP